MPENRKVTLGIVLLSLFWILNGCASSTTAEKAEATLLARSLSENPNELVHQLEREISAARSEQLDVLSPIWFAEAEDAYSSAQKSLKGGKEISVIREYVIKAKAHLKQSEETAAVSRSVLTDTITARELARKSGATRFEKDYGRIESNFLDLTRAIEKNNLRYAQDNRVKVALDFHQLEVRAIKADVLGDARQAIVQAEAAEAKKLAPQAYRAAAERLQAADAFITKNPYAGEKMREMAQQALFFARRALVVTEQSKRFKAMGPEEIALWSENVLQTISGALGAPDRRDHPYEAQLDNILGAVISRNSDRKLMAEKNNALLAEIESVKKDRQDQVKALLTEIEKEKSNHQLKIDEFNLRIALLEGKKLDEQMAKERMERERLYAEQRLDAERRFNQKYIEVQNYFEASEAEVYKQENKLVLRLKAVRFPVGQSIIMPENYPLLSKVQKAIRNFKDPQVIVEGHTDSTGSSEVNEQLSRQRADAVREYLIANQTLPAHQIAAVGYGSERPLASNATPEGRAINRRIDVVIAPQTEQVK